jgi:ACS family tartrate transporter-like MFS transporter
MNGCLGIAGWKWLFVITGSPAIFLGAAVFFYLTDRPEDAHWLSAEEKTSLLSRLAEDPDSAARAMHGIAPTIAHKGSHVSTNKDGLSAVLLDWHVWHFAALYFCLALAMYGFQLWLPQIVATTAKQNASMVALITVIPAVFQAAGMVVIATHSDKTSERRLHVAGAAALAASGLVAATFLIEGNPVWSLLALAVTAFGIWGTVGPFWALTTGRLSQGSAAAAIALINSVGNLGGFAGPYLVGIFKAANSTFGPSLSVIATSLVTASVLALLARQVSKDPATSN